MRCCAFVSPGIWTTFRSCRSLAVRCRIRSWRKDFCLRNRLAWVRSTSGCIRRFWWRTRRWTATRSRCALWESASVDQQHARACGQHREGGGDRGGGEGEDAREGGSDFGARNGRVHQSAADLQLPRAAADGRGEGEHRARGLRGRGASGGGAGR